MLRSFVFLILLVHVILAYPHGHVTQIHFSPHPIDPFNNNVIHTSVGWPHNPFHPIPPPILPVPHFVAPPILPIAVPTYPVIILVPATPQHDIVSQSPNPGINDGKLLVNLILALK